jgi:hypothetical protein
VRFRLANIKEEQIKNYSYYLDRTQILNLTLLQFNIPASCAQEKQYLTKNKKAPLGI